MVLPDAHSSGLIFDDVSLPWMVAKDEAVVRGNRSDPGAHSGATLFRPLPPSHLPLAPPFSVPPLQESHLPFTAEAASPSRNPFEDSQKRRQHVCQRTVARPARTIFADDCFYQTHCAFLKHSQGVFFIQAVRYELVFAMQKDGGV